MMAPLRSSWRAAAGRHRSCPPFILLASCLAPLLLAAPCIAESAAGDVAAVRSSVSSSAMSATRRFVVTGGASLENVQLASWAEEVVVKCEEAIGRRVFFDGFKHVFVKCGCWYLLYAVMVNLHGCFQHPEYPLLIDGRNENDREILEWGTFFAYDFLIASSAILHS